MRTASIRHIASLVPALPLWAAALLVLPTSTALASTGGARAAAGSATAASGSPAGATAQGTTTTGGASSGPGTTNRRTLATWYGPGFYGHRTACGQRMSPTLVGVASRTLACGTLVQFAYEGHELTVPVLDRGPYGRLGAAWDLTAGAAKALAIRETVHVVATVVGSAPNTATLGEAPGASPLTQPAGPTEAQATSSSATGGAAASS
jgi:rare lipoprotein A